MAEEARPPLTSPVPGRDDLACPMRRFYGEPSKAMFVYVIGESDSGPVKVGIGADAPKRLGELQIGNPRQLHLYFGVRSAYSVEIESAVHRELMGRYLRGEWFAADPMTAMTAVGRVLHVADHFGLPSRASIRTVRVVDGIEERRCCTCKNWLPLTDFHTSKVHPSGRQARCKECAKATNRARMAANDEARLRRNEKSRLAQNRRRAEARKITEGRLGADVR